MKVIIAGSRNVTEPEMVIEAIESSKFEITEIVSGCARGVDQLGECWAEAVGVPIKKFKPNWALGKGAGLIRNIQMAEYANALIAIWDGKSRGTSHMIIEARKRGLKVYIYYS